MTDVRLGPFTTARKCACRGWIIATAASSQIADRVRDHQQGEEHKSFDWDAWQDANTAQVPVRTIIRRVA